MKHNTTLNTRLTSNLTTWLDKVDTATYLPANLRTTIRRYSETLVHHEERTEKQVRTWVNRNLNRGRTYVRSLNRNLTQALNTTYATLGLATQHDVHRLEVKVQHMHKRTTTKKTGTKVTHPHRTTQE